MISVCLSLLFQFLCSNNNFVQLGKNPSDVIPLWPDGEVPMSLGNDPEKDVPTLTPYFPDPSRFPYPCPVVIVIPGGGYEYVSYPNENIDFALFLNEYGIASFVLTYRLGPDGYHYPAQYLDVERAIRTVRYHGKVGDWDVDPNRIGIIGCSAGGHLAALALTRFDLGAASLDPLEHVSSRPDLGMLCYPVITMEGEYTHVGSRDNLLGSNSTLEMRNYMSSEKYVTNMTPPTFIFHNEDDDVVPVENSILFDDALEKAGVRHEMHLYPTGGHGVGLGVHPYDPRTVPMDELLPWTADLAKFLIQNRWNS